MTERTLYVDAAVYRINLKNPTEPVNQVDQVVLPKIFDPVIADNPKPEALRVYKILVYLGIKFSTDNITLKLKLNQYIPRTLQILHDFDSKVLIDDNWIFSTKFDCALKRHPYLVSYVALINHVPGASQHYLDIFNAAMENLTNMYGIVPCFL